MNPPGFEGRLADTRIVTSTWTATEHNWCGVRSRKQDNVRGVKMCACMCMCVTWEGRRAARARGLTTNWVCVCVCVCVCVLVLNKQTNRQTDKQTNNLSNKQAEANS
jgi:hypothetical protein